LPNSIWYIESNVHPNMPADAEKVNYRNPGFFGKFWELQQVMWTTNAGLVESHAWDSRPPSWPVLRRGINFWGKDHRQIYLIGNPLIWWSSTAAIGLYVVFFGLAILRWQRSCDDYTNTTFRRFVYELGISVLGWAFHYFPFYLMQRQLFLHHYFPALYFAIITLCQVFDFQISRFKIGSLTFKDKPIVGMSAATVFMALSVVVFVLYAPLTYGNQWTKSECNRVKLFDTWDWDCNNFMDSYQDYSLAMSAPASDNIPTTQAAHGPAPPVADDPQKDIQVTPGAPLAQNLGQAYTEEKVEYRDDQGNLLDEEQVKALEGKVSFSTRYETRTRVVDQMGNEIEDGLLKSEDEGAAKAEAIEPGTIGEAQPGEASTKPNPNAAAAQDVAKDEKLSAHLAAEGAPEPASEPEIKTKDEL